MYKQPEITDKTRQAFIDAFCLLYSKKPLENITVQEIARKAGYNRSTFYQYFFDINDLLSCVEKELLDFIIEKRSKAGTGDQSLVHDLVEMYETKSLYLSALLGEFGSNRFVEQLKTISGIDIPGLDLPDGHKLKPYMTEYRLSGALSLFRLWLLRDKDLSTEEMLSLVSTLYQDGMSEFNKSQKQ